MGKMIMQGNLRGKTKSNASFASKFRNVWGLRERNKPSSSYSENLSSRPDGTPLVTDISRGDDCSIYLPNSPQSSSSDDSGMSKNVTKWSPFNWMGKLKRAKKTKASNK